MFFEENLEKVRCQMTVQITNMIEAGVAYERIVRVIEKLHRTIKVVVTERLCSKREETTTVMMVKNPEDATQVQQFLCQEIGGKEIAVRLSLS